MEFDINLILVPITLALLVAYLADKLWLKQYRVVKDKKKNLTHAEQHLDDAKKTLSASLKSHYGVDDVERFTPNDSTPADVMALYDDYHAAKRKVAEVKSGLAETKVFFLTNWAYEFLPILAFLVVVRAFVLEPFNIPSSSMVPTLYTGDFIVVNKSAYGLRLPITHTKILNTGSPKHGDVAVFRYPENPKRYYIKRVIGLPNDTVRYENGVLSINGQKVSTVPANYTMDKKLTEHLYPDVINGQKISKEQQVQLGTAEESQASYQRETLGEHSYMVRYLTAQQNGEAWEVKVPENSYFVMGDNRERSEDSRFWGFVPEANLAGKATYIWMHKEAGLKMPSFSRVGKID